MDVLVLEKYWYVPRHFIGVFLPYRWPFSTRVRRAIVHEAINVIGNFTVGLAAAVRGGHLSSPGPWARPNPATEAAAVRFVRRKLRASGYAVKSREREICGYDLHATKGSTEVHVEVKGSVGRIPHFFISRTELKAAATDPDWRLAVVLVGGAKAKSYGLITAPTMRRIYQLDPTQWEARPN